MYAFNEEVGIDILATKDIQGQRFSFLNMVCQGTTFQVVWLMNETGGQSSSKDCVDAFYAAWANWAGLPQSMVLDWERTIAAHSRRISRRQACRSDR